MQNTQETQTQNDSEARRDSQETHERERDVLTYMQGTMYRGTPTKTHTETHIQIHVRKCTLRHTLRHLHAATFTEIYIHTHTHTPKNRDMVVVTVNQEKGCYHSTSESEVLYYPHYPSLLLPWYSLVSSHFSLFLPISPYFFLFLPISAHFFPFLPSSSSSFNFVLFLFFLLSAACCAKRLQKAAGTAACPCPGHGH